MLTNLYLYNNLRCACIVMALALQVQLFPTPFLIYNTL